MLSIKLIIFLVLFMSFKLFSGNISFHDEAKKRQDIDDDGFDSEYLVDFHGRMHSIIA